MLRYRTGHGATQYVLDKFSKHLPRMGKIKEVRATRYNGREYITVVGEQGSFRFFGLCWGYHGESPLGLRNLLQKLGVPEKVSIMCAYHLPRGDKNGCDWKLEFPTFKGVWHIC